MCKFCRSFFFLALKNRGTPSKFLLLSVLPRCFHICDLCFFAFVCLKGKKRCKTMAPVTLPRLARPASPTPPPCKTKTPSITMKTIKPSWLPSHCSVLFPADVLCHVGLFHGRPDATAREITTLIQGVVAASRRRTARLSFALVYPDSQGKQVLRQVRHRRGSCFSFAWGGGGKEWPSVDTFDGNSEVNNPLDHRPCQDLVSVEGFSAPVLPGIIWHL